MTRKERGRVQQRPWMLLAAGDSACRDRPREDQPHPSVVWLPSSLAHSASLPARQPVTLPCPQQPYVPNHAYSHGRAAEASPRGAGVNHLFRRCRATSGGNRQTVDQRSRPAPRLPYRRPPRTVHAAEPTVGSWARSSTPGFTAVMTRNVPRWDRGSLLREGAAEQATFVELFFDLAMVFILSRLVEQAFERLAEPHGVSGWVVLGKSLLLFLPLMRVWTLTTYITAQFDPRRPAVQGSVIASVFGVLIFGVSVSWAFDGRAIAFATTYIVMQAGRTLAISLVATEPEVRTGYLRSFCWYAVVSIPWLIGAVCDGTARTALWALAVLVEYVANARGWPVPRLGASLANLWATAARYLAERYQQLLMISFGEPLLAVGVTFTQVPASPYRITALIVAFLTTVLLWRLYFHVAGQLVDDAVLASSHPAHTGRVAGVAHLTMILGIITTSVGHDLVEKHPSVHTPVAWSFVILTGPAIFLVGRSVLEYVVYARVSPPRPAGIVALVALVAPLTLVPPLAVSGAAAIVLLLVAIADTRRSYRHPDEQPTPP
ncbi:low temperature requirement protein A [Micromonospora sp. NPDC007271]|uniref:low temperature requirement protein A n=1 Tax=Micromonospora sp. NPDC007271 TaxID=3154587 RepID=UPI0033C21EF6